MRTIGLTGAFALAGLLTACTAGGPPIRTVSSVDLPRFMGDWYVIAHIPTIIEKEAYNAVESYALTAEGTVATTFTFNEGAFDGAVMRYEPLGFPDPEHGNAVWGMRFVWPFRAEYRVLYLDEGYTTTVIGRRARDYAWIMARDPEIPQRELAALCDLLAREGYDVGALRTVPHRWQ